MGDSVDLPTEDASSLFTSSIETQINASHIATVLSSQRDGLARFEKTNEMLGQCCALSASRLEAAKRELTWYSTMLVDMRKDLDGIFRRIRTFKTTLARQYPEQFAVCAQQHIVSDDTEGEEDTLDMATPSTSSNMPMDDTAATHSTGVDTAVEQLHEDKTKDSQMNQNTDNDPRGTEDQGIPMATGSDNTAGSRGPTVTVPEPDKGLETETTEKDPG